MVDLQSRAEAAVDRDWMRAVWRWLCSNGGFLLLAPPLFGRGAFAPSAQPLGVQACDTQCQTLETDCDLACDQVAPCVDECRKASEACTQKCREAPPPSKPDASAKPGAPDKPPAAPEKKAPADKKPPAKAVPPAKAAPPPPKP